MNIFKSTKQTVTHTKATWKYIDRQKHITINTHVHWSTHSQPKIKQTNKQKENKKKKPLSIESKGAGLPCRDEFFF